MLLQSEVKKKTQGKDEFILLQIPLIAIASAKLHVFLAENWQFYIRVMSTFVKIITKLNCRAMKIGLSCEKQRKFFDDQGLTVTFDSFVIWNPDAYVRTGCNDEHQTAITYAIVILFNRDYTLHAYFVCVLLVYGAYDSFVKIESRVNRRHLVKIIALLWCSISSFAFTAASLWLRMNHAYVRM